MPITCQVLYDVPSMPVMCQVLYDAPSMPVTCQVLYDAPSMPVMCPGALRCSLYCYQQPGSMDIIIPILQMSKLWPRDIRTAGKH